MSRRFPEGAGISTMPASQNKALKHRPDIDGLRAIAVLPVLFFHANLGFTGGYVGVDVFFVISGFLITGLILRDLEAGQFHMVRFWERRIRRILPALALVVFATLVAGWFLLLPQGFKELGESASAQVLLASNIYFWFKSWAGAGYFAPAAEVKPLLHTWSLAVEEQFYLVFPFLLAALWRFTRHSLVPAILLLGGVSFGLSVWCSYQYPSLNFYFLPTRAWELLMGAYLAAIPAQRHSSPRGVTEFLSWGGLLAILCAVFCYDHETRFPGVTALLPCLGAALIIWANGHTLTSVGKLLALRPVVFIGLISYSLYLWHWPILVFFKYWAIDPIPTSQRLLLLLASLVLAGLSWKFVETPFRKRVIFKTRSQIFTFAATTTALLLFAALVIFKLHGLPSRLPADALRYANGESLRETFREEVSLKDALTGNFVELGMGNKQQQIDLLVWGDSHAMAAMPALDFLCKKHSVRGVAATHSATAPLVGFASHFPSIKNDNIAFNAAVVNFIHNKRVKNVVIVARWDGYGTTARLHRSLQDTISAMNGTGARIWIMRQVPKQRWNVPRVLGTVAWRGGDPEELGLSLVEYRTEFRRLSPIFDGLAVESGALTILDPIDMLVKNNVCRVAHEGEALYRDEDHLTAAGAMLLRPLFEPIFEGIGTVR